MDVELAVVRADLRRLGEAVVKMVAENESVIARARQQLESFRLWQLGRSTTRSEWCDPTIYATACQLGRKPEGQLI